MIIHFFFPATAKNPKRIKKNDKKKLDFSQCIVTNDSNVPRNLIQICADDIEVNRRLNTFVDRKREENNYNNIKDFIEIKTDDVEENNSCARTNSIIFKTKNSKGHFNLRSKYTIRFKSFNNKLI